MANKIRLEIEGLQELASKLTELGLDVESVFTDAVLAAGELVADAANSNAPGPNIMAEVDDEESTQTRIVVNIGPSEDKWYYRFAETGATEHEITGVGALAFQGRAGLVITKSVQHPGVTAKPFLRPALASNKDQARDEIGKRIKDVIDSKAE